MLTEGNIKLGPQVWGWSIPAKTTCPGASLACKKLCYGLKGHFLWGSTQEAHKRNRRTARRAAFVDEMVDEIRQCEARVVRVHVVGDFYSEKYIRKWITIARRSPNVMFYAYTRSWVVPDLRSDLKKLARLENFQLWLSGDSSMPNIPRWRGVRTCYLMQSDSDQPKAPVDLLFRSRRTSPLKYSDAGQLVCPYDQGVKRKSPVTCSRCQLCWSDSPIPSKNQEVEV